MCCENAGGLLCGLDKFYREFLGKSFEFFLLQTGSLFDRTDNEATVEGVGNSAKETTVLSPVGVRFSSSLRSRWITA